VSAGAPGEPLLRGERALGVVLRTAHLAAMALAVGAAAWAPAAVPTWLGWSAGTGAALLVLEASHGPHWAVQVRGLLVLSHVAVLGLLYAGAAASALLAALCLGAIGSHLPKRLRKWSVLHRRTLE